MPLRPFVNNSRLLDRGIIKDAYPLHDGPYYILEKPLQEGTDVNGRQVRFLSYNYTSHPKVLKKLFVRYNRGVRGQSLQCFYFYTRLVFPYFCVYFLTILILDLRGYLQIDYN